MTSNRSPSDPVGDAPLPVEVSELDARWFSRVLGHDVVEATVLATSSGTTGRAQVALRGEPGLPARVFVKLAPFDEGQRALVDITGMGVAEARFYRELATAVPVRVPGAWFADTDGGRYVMVLEDLTLSGCRFPTPDDHDIEARVRDLVEQLASLHAAFWESDRFEPGGDLDWLATRGSADDGGAGRSFIAQAVDALGDRMDESFHRVAELYIARAPEIVRLLNEGPGTLVHGDSHLGNLFVDVADDDRTGFLDWAVLCRAPGVRDLAYSLCNSVPVDLREAVERELVDRYCELLARAGVDLDGDEAWRQYRIWALYSWVAATATAGMGSKWQPIEVGISATERATAACAHLDTVGLLGSLLG